MNRLAYLISFFLLFSLLSCSDNYEDIPILSGKTSDGFTRSVTDNETIVVGSGSCSYNVVSSGEYPNYITLKLTEPRSATLKGIVTKGFNQWGDIAAHDGTRVNLIRLSSGTVITLDLTVGLYPSYPNDYYERSTSVSLSSGDYVLSAAFTNELGTQWGASGKHGCTQAVLIFE